MALAQLPVEDGNLTQNMRLAEDAAGEAARQQVDFLSLPEAADWGCSLVARPDGTAAIVAKFKEPDLVVYDIPVP